MCVIFRHDKGVSQLSKVWLVRQAIRGHEQVWMVYVLAAGFILFGAAAIGLSLIGRRTKVEADRETNHLFLGVGIFAAGFGLLMALMMLNVDWLGETLQGAGFNRFLLVVVVVFGLVEPTAYAAWVILANGGARPGFAVRSLMIWTNVALPFIMILTWAAKPPKGAVLAQTFWGFWGFLVIMLYSGILNYFTLRWLGRGGSKRLMQSARALGPSSSLFWHFATAATCFFIMAELAAFAWLNHAPLPVHQPARAIVGLTEVLLLLFGLPIGLMIAAQHLTNWLHHLCGLDRLSTAEQAKLNHTNE